MALIKCPECGREVSDKAPTCPNCGAPIAAPHVESSLAENETEVPPFKTEPGAGAGWLVCAILFLFVAVIGLCVFFILGLIMLIPGIMLASMAYSKLKPHADCVCPYCGAKHILLEGSDNFKCPACRKISVYVKDRHALSTVR